MTLKIVSATTLLVVFLTSILTACAGDDGRTPPPPTTSSKKTMSVSHRDTATLAGGCFWCIEAVYQLLDGVELVESGYCGGSVKDPSYKEVCTGTTGHAEVCRITFDPSVVSYEDILQVFFASHDPTTLNRQGNDAGTQYRSAVFYHNEEQKRIASDYIKQLTSAHTWPDPIVTEVVPADKFYKAEDYHQNYFAQNGTQPYCQFVVRPKVEKFQKQFKDKMRSVPK
ncbi:MAG: peptide-methionine (S)-S-oxide reductase MsrA [Candidatus Kapabacteria bacterium]|nr:peptide-methionine (S)-S-oxide reductase MsrA [Candidatus Kapabacteria bacterium]